MDAGNDPALEPLVDMPYPLPLLGRVGMHGNNLLDVTLGATSPLDSRIAHIDQHIGDHGATSTETSWSLLATSPTNRASPCPVTAEIAKTSRPSSFSKRARTSSLPVNSALLTAAI